MTPYVYPDDFPGFVGDGASDDYPAISAALASAAPNQSLYFAGNYATSKTITPGPTPIECSGKATLTAAADCATAFSGLAGATRHRVPRLMGFTGSALVLTNGVSKIECQVIANCGAAVALGPGAIDNEVSVHWMANLTDCLRVSSPTGSPVQGNTVSSNFAVKCLHGLNFDGSKNCDSNTIELESWDSDGLAAACVFLNTGPVALANWRLRCTNWIGGLPGVDNKGASQAWVAKGVIGECEFNCGNLITNDWGAYAITGGGGNTFKTATATGTQNGFIANWQASPNNRAVFGAPVYQNTRRCNGKCVPMPAGTLVTYYVYSPFTDGNSYGFRAVPIVNPGFELFSIVDNSAIVPNEVAITWRAVNQISPHAPQLYDEFDFMFTSGLP